MKDYPKIQKKEGSLVVEFSPPGQVKSQHLEMVLDYDQWDEVIGVEIISLFSQVGKNCLGLISAFVPTQSDGLKYAYDEDCDCFYLRLKIDRSLYQRVVQGTVCLDRDGQIVNLSAEWQK